MAAKFRILPKICDGCGVCYKVCLDIAQAIPLGPPYVIDPALCTACKECYNQCPIQAIEEFDWEPDPVPPDIATTTVGWTGTKVH